MHFKMLSAICFNLDLSKILSSGNELINFSLNSKSKLPSAKSSVLEKTSSKLLNRFEKLKTTTNKSKEISPNH